MRRLTSIVWIVCGLLAFTTLIACGADRAAPLSAQIEAVFRSAHESGNFDGSVLVTRGGQTIYEGGFGLADAQKKTANTATTRFLAYSLSKPFTAVLVFQQIEAHELALGDALMKFFPQLEGTAAGAITLEQLLTHTSGIDEVISHHRDRRITAADLGAAIVRSAGDYQYSNTGFVVLALVLENATGRGYAELLEEKILRPAGMHDSGVLRTGTPVDGLATGYRNDGKGREVSALEVPPEVIDGAGSLYTTARDLARFDRALAAGELLSAPSQAQMLRQHTPEHGYGWSLSEQGGKYFPWQEGGHRGFAAMFVRQIHRQEMIAILSNDENADVRGLRTQTLRLLKRGAVER